MATAISHTLLCPGSPGDLVVFQRPLYKHYAINVGNDQIVHVTSGDGLNSLDIVDGIVGQMFSAIPDVAVIKLDKFSDFYQDGDEVYYVKTHDKEPLSRMEIVERALSKVGEKGYNLFKQNCEHFARWCCYGEEESPQADALEAVGGLVLGGLAVVGAGMLLANFLKDNSEEDDRKVKEYRWT